MGKSKTSYKETFLYCNVLIFMGLVGLCVYLNRDIQEGITNMGCCGGIEAGVHYSETDRKPPEYVRRCFKSEEQDGETVYSWSGFPCTGSKSNDCCDNKGECVATSKGGYCKLDTGSNVIFNRRSNESKPYVKRSNDEILDINDVNDMKDYFYDRKQKGKDLSPEMQRFMARRSKNETYMEQHMINKLTSNESMKKENKEKLNDQEKNIQMVYSITIIHLLLLVSISIVIKQALVDKIQLFLDLLYLQYMKFSGKTIN
jgi:hypothetical protein